MRRSFSIICRAVLGLCAAVLITSRALTTRQVSNDALAQRRVDALIRGRRGRQGRCLLRLRHALLDRVEPLADPAQLAQILTQRISGTARTRWAAALI